MKIGSDYYFYQNDHLGTPQKLTAINGAVVWAAKYSSFGKATIEVETVENNLRFPGQHHDQETGLHYNLFRYYGPQIGRYLRTDPIRLDLLLFGSAGLELFNLGSKNPYNYVENNPINFNDPLGLIKCECGKEPYYDKEVFITCMINATIGIELIGPSISLMKKYNKRQFYRIAKKFGKKWGARIVPGIGWLITGVDFINNLGKCHQKAQRCL